MAIIFLVTRAAWTLTVTFTDDELIIEVLLRPRGKTTL
jgi:hypothetical protein